MKIFYSSLNNLVIIKLIREISKEKKLKLLMFKLQLQHIIFRININVEN